MASLSEDPIDIPSYPPEIIPEFRAQLRQQRQQVSPAKRPRASSASTDQVLTLPPYTRARPPPLKPSNNFWFEGVYPKFNTVPYLTQFTHMIVSCGQPNCTKFLARTVVRTGAGTNNYRNHYVNHHPYIPHLREEERLANLSKK